MKPAHYFIGIAGVTALFGGAVALRSKMQYDADGREIVKLIAEFKAMGVATNGDEYFHKIPDEQNAWPELEPLLFQPGPNGSKREIFKPSVASSFLVSGTKADLPLIRKYLSTNHNRLDSIRNALDRKPKIQVPHDYDEGFMMLCPELASLKFLANEFCVAALADCMEENSEGMVKNLGEAILLSNYGFERGEWFSVAVSIGIQTQINRACLKMIEVNPKAYRPIFKLLSSPENLAKINHLKLFESTFLEQIETCRYYDIPKMDWREPPFPINLVVKKPETDPNGILEEGGVHHGDYIPVGPNMRSYMRAVLERWKPFITKLVNSKDPNYYPPYAEYVPINDMRSKAPEYLKQITGMDYIGTDVKESYENIDIGVVRQEGLLLAFQIYGVTQSTGHLPNDISRFINRNGPLHNLGDLSLEPHQKGFLVRTKSLWEDEKKPLFEISYPSALTISATRKKGARDAIEEYRVE